MSDWLALLLGVLCAGLGGELFVRGAVGLARWARVSPGIIGATVAAFATSSPELAVSVSAATAGRPQIALGDALGSNIVNVALILGIALLLSGIRAPRDDIRRDFPLALLAPLAVALLIFDERLSRLDGALLLVVFAVWLALVTRDAHRERSAASDVLGETNRVLVVLQSAVGLALLVAAGHFIVTGAKHLALGWGMDEFLVGTTVVALATSTPELATTLVAHRRGHDEVGLGTILGSNIFNVFLIAGVAAAIAPIAIPRGEVALALGFGLLTVAAVYPPHSGFIARPRGALLLALYASYLAAVWQLR